MSFGASSGTSGGPIFDTDLDDSAVWEVWIDGFWRAAELTSGWWMELVPEDDEEVGIAFFSLSRLHELAASIPDEIEPLDVDPARSSRSVAPALELQAWFAGQKPFLILQLGPPGPLTLLRDG